MLGRHVFYFMREQLSSAFTSMILLATASKCEPVKKSFAVCKLSIKDLEKVRKFLGKRVVLNISIYTIDQQAEIEETVDQHGLVNAKT